MLVRYLLATFVASGWCLLAEAQTPVKRATPWTSSHIVGAPDLPMPLSLQPAFPKLTFNDPMHIRWQADAERYFVCELGGKLWSFPHDEDVTQADLVVDFKSAIKSFDTARSGGCENVYSIAFDPDFKRNRFIYVCMIFNNKTSKPLDDGSRISRFVVSESNPPTIDVASELKILTWVGGGHNGCDLAFDKAGCLLISTGDAADPVPPDKLQTGQDCSDFLSSVLRVDVRGASSDAPYKIPTDNPFPNLTGVRPEIWAFGFRNPWRISIDTVTDQLWLGDVGWEKWEMVHHVVRGGNYGWAIREAHELLRPELAEGPSPILPPRVTLAHADAASVTGGFVYRGKQLAQIAGQYLFGDWVNGRIWSVPLDEHSPHVEVASGQLRIIAFSPDRDGEPLVVNHLSGTNMFRLVPNADYETELAAMRGFPVKLSQTGIFTDTAEQIPATGVRAFAVNQPQWQDGAVGAHYLAVPDDKQVAVYKDPQPVGVLAMFNSRLHYPTGTVLAKTITMLADATRGRAKPWRIETQLLHFDGRLWRGYSYLWNAEQTDAELVDAAGTELTLPGSDGQRWRVHSRTECMQCHNPWPETTLAFTPEQLHEPERGLASQWLQLVTEGLVVTLESKDKAIAPQRCVRQPLLAADSNDVATKARAYLHVNCAHCHQNGAGAGVEVSLRMQDNGAAMKGIDVLPSKGNFGIEGAHIISQGAPDHSVLLYRIASVSTGRMPHIGSREVDLAAVSLIHDWIAGLDADKSSTKSDSLKGGEPTAPRKLTLAGLESRARQLSAMLTLADSKDTADARSQRMEVALELAVDLAKVMHAARATNEPLRTPAWLKQLAQAPDPLVSSLFEAHLPARLRTRRLGPATTYSDMADIAGDVERGRAYFADTARSQCSKCHRIGNQGGQVGPAMDGIGKKLSAAQLFEAIADPSRIIESKYQTHTVVTVDGRAVSGLLVSETAKELVLVNAQGEQVRLAIDDIESRKLDSKSIMPGGLAGELTAQQAADLLAFLSSLK